MQRHYPPAPYVPVIAVINRKGGSGKSTIATHIAASLAHEGHPSMLGDIDAQQSSRAWLRRRNQLDPRQAPRIQGWIVDKLSVARPPAGVTHLVLDTPASLTGFNLARLVMWCDAIVVPVCDSAFDRESAAACHAEMRDLPRVSAGRCQIGVVGMRVDRRTKGHAALRAWAADHGMHFLGSLRATQLYVAAAESGMTLFDLPPAKSAADLEEWSPVLEWLKSATLPRARAAPSPPARRPELVAPPAPDPREASVSLPPSLDAEIGQLTLTHLPKGFWGRVRRLWGS
jgi:chromosome partitioning protein